MSFTCSFASCNSIESLPFQCQNCKKFYCRKHYPYDKHNCSYITNKTFRYISEEDTRVKCEIDFCNCDENLKKCDECKKIYCKKHVLPWHVCINKSVIKKQSFLYKIKKLIFN